MHEITQKLAEIFEERAQGLDITSGAAYAYMAAADLIGCYSVTVENRLAYGNKTPLQDLIVAYRGNRTYSESDEEESAWTEAIELATAFQTSLNS